MAKRKVAMLSYCPLFKGYAAHLASISDVPGNFGLSQGI
jgi:hypothetical protein